MRAGAGYVTACVPASLETTEVNDEAARRAALARWLTEPANALTDIRSGGGRPSSHTASSPASATAPARARRRFAVVRIHDCARCIEDLNRHRRIGRRRQVVLDDRSQKLRAYPRSITVARTVEMDP